MACAEFRLIGGQYGPPAVVKLFFQLSNCQGTPLPGASSADFVIRENGQKVSAFENDQKTIEDPKSFKQAMVLMLDMSGSIIASGNLEALQASARKFVQAIGAEQPIAIYTFDGREDASLLVSLTDDVEHLVAGIDSLSKYEVFDKSTNLNGAVLSGLGHLDVQRQAAGLESAIFAGTLVVFTDGVDQAAYVSSGQVDDGLAVSEHTVLTIGLGVEIDQAALGAIGKDGAYFADDVTTLEQTFQEAEDRITALASSFYILAYCSGKRAGSHVINLSLEGAAGELTYPFEADDFGAGCSPGSFLPCTPDCTDQQCGDDGCGGTCGTCAAGQGCTEAGECEACTPACDDRVCGDDGCGGTCGYCTGNGACTALGECVCQPTCSGACGPDGCGGSCGTCAPNQGCLSGQCVDPGGCYDDWCVIPPGDFVMGSPTEEPCRAPNETLRLVTITRPFAIQAIEMPWATWLEFDPAPPGRALECPECPIRRITWFAAAHMANLLSAAHGLDECYALIDCGDEPSAVDLQCADVAFHPAGLDCPGYRLPTDAEWEYAARAGSPYAFPNGPIGPVNDCWETSDPTLNEVAWYANHPDFPGDRLAFKPGGLLLPNAWGLYDVLGNVPEWTHSRQSQFILDPDEAKEPLTDPFELPGPGDSAALRGGFLAGGLYTARLASRTLASVGYGYGDLYEDGGLRLVRTILP